jgi:hypothetical protein
MRIQPIAALVALGLVLASPSPPSAFAQTRTEPEQPPVGLELGPVYLRAEAQTLFIYRNDTDFDRSPPLYDENGQSAGAFATLLRPMLTWNVTGSVRIYYEAELGLNYWSRNNPDAADALQADVFVMKHRELWAGGEFLDQSLGLKLGYGRFLDPTGLFLNHWIGQAQVWVGGEENRFGLFVGQLPDPTHEGIDIRDNNFVRDIFVYGGRLDWRLARGHLLQAALLGLYDAHQPGRERWVLTPAVHYEAGQPGDKLRLGLDALLQVGQAEGQTLDGRIQNILAWAAQAHLRWDITERLKLWPSRLDVNLLFLSPDDAHAGNARQHAVLQAAKNRSATLMLTEDEVRDWYDNVDERLAGFSGGFYQNRAGLFVGDVDAMWRLVEEVWQLRLVLGAATALKPENAMGHTFAGFEADLINTFQVDSFLVFHLVFGVLVPGGAAAVMLNGIDPEATDPIWMAELSAMVRY